MYPVQGLNRSNVQSAILVLIFTAINVTVDTVGTDRTFALFNPRRLGPQCS